MPAPNPDELLRQFHHNQSLWLARLSSRHTHPQMPHARLFQSGQTRAMRPGAAGVIMLPISDDTEAALNEHNHALEWLRQARSRDSLVWSMTPNPEIDLALLAQGYSAGFDPWWMTADLSMSIPEPGHIVRPMHQFDIEPLREADIPYVISDQINTNLALSTDPQGAQVLWLVAFENDQPVGHAIVNFQDDHAGLFNVGVSGKHRHRGVGTSLTLAAMRAARDRGMRTMNLNSTPAGKRLYDRTGFTQFDIGQTWIRSGRQMYSVPDEKEQALVYAIGTGDIVSIALHPILYPQFTCGMTAQEIAARFGQGEALLEIIRQGQTPEIISLWNAGLREEAIAATKNPDAREKVTGSRRGTPLHYAIELGAGTLVIELINAGANLLARDREYNATPLDWAHATNKPTIARIIRQSEGR